MATLPRLYPAPPDGTATTMAAPVGAPTYAEAMQTNDGDTSYATSGLDSAGSVFVNLDNTPTDFATMDSLSVSCIVRLNGTITDDTTALYAQVFTADEATALTDELLVTDQNTGGTYTVDTTNLVLTTTGASADKATWDNARLRLRWEYVKNRASDGIALWVTQAYIDGVYTPSGPVAPVADAGPAQIVAYGSLATLDGSGTTDATSYTWEQMAGPAVTLSNPNAISPTFTAPSTREQLRFRLTATSDIGTDSDEVIIGTAATNIRTREQWGADESLMTWTPTYYALQTITLHHTAQLSSEITDYDAYMRSVYQTHAVTNGWGDIGYHLLVSQDGTVYEGRYAGNDGNPGHNSLGEMATAAHTSGYNSGNLGISIIIDATQERPTQAALDAALAHTTDLVVRHGADPQAIIDYVNPADGATASGIHTISSHSDWPGQSTACPGDFFHPHLVWYRRESARGAGQTVLPPRHAKFYKSIIPSATYQMTPLRAADGSLYIFTIHEPATGSIRVLKSTDGGYVWVPPTLEVWKKGTDPIDAVAATIRTDGVIDVWVMDSSRDVSHKTYNTNDDTWAASGTWLDIPAPAPPMSYLSATVRPIDNMSFVQAPDTVDANGNQQVRGIRRLGGTFYHHTTYDGSESYSFYPGPATMGTEDIHLAFNQNNPAGPRVYHRAWVASDTFGVRDVIDNSPYNYDGPVMDVSSTVKVGTDIWNVYMDSGGMALKRYVSQASITPNSDEQILTSIIPDYINSVPRINLSYYEPDNALIVTYLSGGVLNSRRFYLDTRTWGDIVPVDGALGPTVFAPFVNTDDFIVFYRADDGTARFGGRELITAGPKTVNAAAALQGNATTTASGTILARGIVSAASFEVPVPDAVYSSLSVQSAASLSVTSTVETTNVTLNGTAALSGESTLAPSATVSTTSTVSITSTASKLTVAFAEKFAQVSAQAYATQTTDSLVASQGALTFSGTSTGDVTASATTASSLTAHSEAFTQVVPSVEASGTFSVVSDAAMATTEGVTSHAASTASSLASTSIISGVTSTGSVAIDATGSQMVVAEAEKFGTLVIQSDSTMAANAVGESDGASTLHSEASTVISGQASTAGVSAAGAAANMGIREEVSASDSLTLPATSDVYADSAIVSHASSSMVADAQTTVLTQKESEGQVSIAATGSQMVVAEAEKFSALALNGLSNASASASVEASTTLTASAIASAAVQPEVEATGRVATDGSATTSIAEEVVAVGSPTFDGYADTIVEGAVGSFGTTTLNAEARFEALSEGSAEGQVSIQATGSQMLVAEAEKFASLSISGAATTAIDATAGGSTRAVMRSSASMAAVAGVESYGASTTDSAATLGAVGANIAHGSTSSIANAFQATSGQTASDSRVTAAATSGMAASGAAETSGQVAVDATGSQLIVAFEEKFASLGVVATSATRATATAETSSRAEFRSTAGVTTTGARGVSASAAMGATSTLSTEAVSGQVSAVTMQGGAGASIRATQEHFGAVSIDATGSTVTVAFEEKFASISARSTSGMEVRALASSEEYIALPATSTASISGTRVVVGETSATSGAALSITYSSEAVAAFATQGTATFTIGAGADYFVTITMDALGRMSLRRTKPVPQLDSRSDLGTLTSGRSDRKTAISGSKSRGLVVGSYSEPNVRIDND